MRILFFNWKDGSHPAAGGAELFTHEIATRFVTSGHDVTLFCAAHSGAPRRDVVDGVQVVRRGGRFGVYHEAQRYWHDEGHGRFDVVIDEVNTRPFLTPRFVHDTPVVCLIHQLAAEVWHEEMPPVAAHIGRYWLEPRWLRAYRDVPTITVSSSTRDDLVGLGFRNVAVVTEGCSVKPVSQPLPKEQHPTMLFVGRLVRTKRPDHAVRAHALLRARVPDARLWVVGDGYMRGALERTAAPGVRFFGRVGDEDKLELMQRAHVLAVPGVREGWGLAVIEANAMGTPAVGYAIPGLRDSILDRQTGLLVRARPDALAAGVERIFSSPSLGAALGDSARFRASGFRWESTARDCLRFIEAACGITNARTTEVGA